MTIVWNASLRATATRRRPVKVASRGIAFRKPDQATENSRSKPVNLTGIHAGQQNGAGLDTGVITYCRRTLAPRRAGRRQWVLNLRGKAHEAVLGI
jgi:hypothetical protein